MSLMKPINGYFLIEPEDLEWRPSNMMKIPNADFLERTRSEILGARLWKCHRKARTRCIDIRKQKSFILLSKARVECASARRRALFQNMAACSSVRSFYGKSSTTLTKKCFG